MSAAYYEAIAESTRAEAPVVLETRSLVMRFGGITATNQVSLQLRQGARHALIGPNGAGKTTLINQLTGVLAPSEGSVWLDGQDITTLAPHLRVQRGLVRTFQFNQADVAHQPTRVLAYGKRRLLEMAIALACEPRVLLLDEPVAGVPAGERDELLQTVAALPADVSVLLIEHDMDLVFSFARRMTVLVNGTVLTEGEPEAIANDPQVKAVYLGHGDAHG